MHSLKRALRYLRAGEFRLLAEIVAGRLYANDEHIGVRRSTEAALPPMMRGLTLRLRPLVDADRALLVSDPEAEKDDSFRELASTLHMLDAGLQTGYVACTTSGEVGVFQWLIGSTQNERMDDLYHGLYPPLAPDEAYLEGMFTLPAFRGRGFFIHLLPPILEEAEKLGARWLISYPSTGDVPTLRMLKSAGFVPFALRRETYRFFRRRVTFEPLPEGAPYPFEHAANRDAAGHLRVLLLTSEWPTPATPHTAPYVVRQAKFLERAGVEVEVFPFRGGQRPANYVRAWRRLRRTVDLSKFDLVHAQFGQAGLLALPKRLPLVVTFRGSDILGILGENGRTTMRGKVLQRTSRLVARAADAVIIVSEGQRSHLPARVEPHLLPSGVDPDLIPNAEPKEARRRLGLSEGVTRVLFVGPATYGKGHDVAQAAVRLLETRLPAELVVAEGRTQADVLLLMRACDVLLFSSRQEGSPDVVKEGLVCSIPIVATPVGDIAERLRGIEGCEVVPDWEPETIASALERVLARGRRIDAGAAAAELDENVLTERLIGIYRSTMARE